MRIRHHIRHDKGTEWSPEVFGCPGTEAQRVRPMRGGGGIDDEAIEPGNGFMSDFRDDQDIGQAQHMLPLWPTQTEVQTAQKGHECGRMLYNELEQGDILSAVRFGVAL